MASGTLALPPVVPWVLGFAGLGLLYSAVRNQSPLGQLRAVISGQPSPGSLIDSSASSSASSGAASSGNVPDAPSPSGLIILENAPGYTPATFRLTPAAAVAFRAWEKVYGARIPVTGGWRSAEEQAAQHAKDPGRFGTPETSYHVKGAAVDVNNDWLGGLPATEANRLRVTAKLSGWGQARFKPSPAGCGSNKTVTDEPWHFSWGGCG